MTLGIRIMQATYNANTPTEYPTGKEVLDELNAYRVEQGLPPFILSESLCNNIAERWKVYRVQRSHQGLDEFRRKWMPEVSSIGEVMVSGNTAKEMVEGWASSPSHDILIKEFRKVCVYSADGSSVALLSN